MNKEDTFAKLDALYQRYAQQESWQQAAQNRMQTASFAQSCGQTDRFYECSKNAIELAQDHNLRRLELGFHLTLLNLSLILDKTGEILDKLPQKLDWKPGFRDNKEVAQWNGTLSKRLDAYESEALLAYDSAGVEFDKAVHSSSPQQDLKDSLKQIVKQANAFALTYGGQFEEALNRLDSEPPAVVLSEQFLNAVFSAKLETAQICASLRIDLFLLAAELAHRRGDNSNDTAEKIFQAAEEMSEALPDKQCAIYMAWSDHYDSCGDLEHAINYANKAVEVSKKVSFSMLKGQVAAKLSGLLGRLQSKPSTADMGAFDQVTSILANAHQDLLASRYEDSLKLVNEALPFAVNPQLRRMVIRVRAIVFYEMNRFAKAETDIDECIALLSSELSSDKAVAEGKFDNRILEEEDIYLIKAWLRAKAGQSKESWDVAEQGRSRRLKREIVASTHSLSEYTHSLRHLLEDTTFETIRPWLSSNRVAMLSFAATRWGTLALTSGPDDSEPEARILDQFPYRELKRLLGPNQVMDSAIICDSISDLSASLIHPLHTRLRAITQDARVLYIIPDAFLHYAPFAALTLEKNSPGSSTLIDLCPLAIIPSSVIPFWCSTRRGATNSRDCLAVAVGNTNGFEFHDHLNQVAAAPWPNPLTKLSDADATVEEVTAQAPNYPVLYFSCHGDINSATQDIMAASRLQLAGTGDKQFLRASEVSKWKINTDLVFLNACQSGRFKLQARSEVNGFVRAFLLAGARSLIAPVIHVNPTVAGDLAEAFFSNWLTGSNMAEALRRAQNAVRQRHPDSKDWAAYYLVGDYL